MRILVSNDDGIQSPGIQALVKSLQTLGEVWVVAPDREQSAVGHAITLSNPIRLTNWKLDGAHAAFAIDGTPADCVKLALTELLPSKPDLLVSGINRGENTGISVIYSGTVSAATEGTINGIHSIAVSLDSFTSSDYAFAATMAKRIAKQVTERSLPEGTLLNVNVPALPAEHIKGVRIAKQGKIRFQEVFMKRQDPRGRTYYWMDGNKIDIVETETDGSSLNEGYVSITPIHLDMTHHAFIEKLESWKLTHLNEVNS